MWVTLLWHYKSGDRFNADVLFLHNNDSNNNCVNYVNTQWSIYHLYHLSRDSRFDPLIPQYCIKLRSHMRQNAFHASKFRVVTKCYIDFLQNI